MENTKKYQEIIVASLAEVKSQLADIAIFNEETGDWIIRTDNIDQTAADISIQADAAEAADERLTIVAELENRFRHLNLALDKIKAGTYGLCEISNEPIEIARLEANPAARTCTAHMEQEHMLPL